MASQSCCSPMVVRRREEQMTSLSSSIQKVDGANLGLSLTRDYTVVAQNRSHTVCSATHTQFKGLDDWLEEHSWALCQLLKPEQEVLFGEWCLARHSVPYTRLPGYFIAFDILDKRTSRFLQGGWPPG